MFFMLIKDCEIEQKWKINLSSAAALVVSIG